MALKISRVPELPTLFLHISLFAVTSAWTWPHMFCILHHCSSSLLSMPQCSLMSQSLSFLLGVFPSVCLFLYFVSLTLSLFNSFFFCFLLLFSLFSPHPICLDYPASQKRLSSSSQRKGQKSRVTKQISWSVFIPMSKAQGKGCKLILVFLDLKL